MKPLDRDHFELATGRRFYAFMGMLSAGEDQDGKVFIGYGHDGAISEFMDDDSDDLIISGAERQEIADYMIERWQRWAGQK